MRKTYRKEGFSKPVFEYRPDWPYLSIGFGDERDYFVENLSLLISSGLSILEALNALGQSMKSKRMKKIVGAIEQMVQTGMPLWETFAITKILPERVISLVRSGEESGRLADHLNLVTVQRHKDKVLRSRITSALMYPGIVLFLSAIVALGSSWLVLPKLAFLFAETKSTLPVPTLILMAIGDFFRVYGAFAVPGAALLLALVVYLFFVYKKTKFIGDAILFSIPGVRTLVQGVEIARFGYIFGVLLQAGFSVSEALGSVKKGTVYARYRKFYASMSDSVERGESFKMFFENFPKSRKYIPIPIQQLIVSAEKSGRLSETSVKIGLIYEEKTEAMSRDLTTVLEPVVLVIVGLVVGFIVLSVMGPLYELSNQI